MRIRREWELPKEEWEYPIRRDWRYSPGDLVRVNSSHYAWSDRVRNVSLRVEEGELLIFLRAYGFNNSSTWKRSEWNTMVISPIHGIVWVPDEYTERVV